MYRQFAELAVFGRRKIACGGDHKQPRTRVLFRTRVTFYFLPTLQGRI